MSYYESASVSLVLEASGFIWILQPNRVASLTIDM
jgi:hypothetical protein